MAWVSNGKFTADEVASPTVVALSQIFIVERGSNQIKGMICVFNIILVVRVLGEIQQKIYQNMALPVIIVSCACGQKGTLGHHL
jgi:hypothetical protein